MSTKNDADSGIIRRVAGVRRKSERLQTDLSTKPTSTTKNQTTWIDNSFMSGAKKISLTGKTPRKGKIPKQSSLVNGGTSTPKTVRIIIINKKNV